MDAGKATSDQSAGVITAEAKRKLKNDLAVTNIRSRMKSIRFRFVCNKENSRKSDSILAKNQRHSSRWFMATDLLKILRVVFKWLPSQKCRGSGSTATAIWATIRSRRSEKSIKDFEPWLTSKTRKNSSLRSWSRCAGKWRSCGQNWMCATNARPTSNTSSLF